MVTPITIEEAFRRLQDRIDALRDSAENAHPADWQKLRADVDQLCTTVTRMDTESAHALLPTISAMITALDDMVDQFTTAK